MASPELCLICGTTLETGELVTIRRKVIDGIVANSKRRGDKKWLNFKSLNEATLHHMCHRAYVSEAYPDSDASYNFQANCFFCDSALDKTHKEVHAVSSDDVTVRLLTKASEIDDDWSKTVRERIEGVPSLTDANASYHRKCYNRFMRRKEPLDENPGRPSPPKILKRKRTIDKEDNIGIIKRAAKVIRADIKSKMPELLMHQDDVTEFIPETLQALVDQIMFTKQIDQDSFDSKHDVILAIIKANVPNGNGVLDDDDNEPSDEPININYRTRSRSQGDVSMMG